MRKSDSDVYLSIIETVFLVMSSNILIVDGLDIGIKSTIVK